MKRMMLRRGENTREVWVEGGAAAIQIACIEATKKTGFDLLHMLMRTKKDDLPVAFVENNFTPDEIRSFGFYWPYAQAYSIFDFSTLLLLYARIGGLIFSEVDQTEWDWFNFDYIGGESAEGSK